MTIQYIEGTNIAYYNGKRFRREKNKYYKRIENGHSLYLHRYVYQNEVGEIPKGYDIHHIDGNKANNDISNLKLLTKAEHKKAHVSEELAEIKRNNLKNNARPKAIEWHKSEAGRKWHSEIAKGRIITKKSLVCSYCGNSFEGVPKHDNTFCSNRCKSAYRRKMGFDNEERICVMCNNEFLVNKYSKTVCCSKNCASKLRWKNKRSD